MTFNLHTRLADDDALDEALAYHDLTRTGFVSMFTPGQKRTQQSFRLSELPSRLSLQRELRGDVYLTQNEFFRPGRQVVHCTRLTSFYLDLDTYNVGRLQGRAPEFLAEAALRQLHDQGLPEPSQIVFSGRGLQLKWVLERPVPAGALPRWTAVQRKLCERMTVLGADAKALDASRVLRVVGSVHTKSGELVRMVHRAQVPAPGASMRADGLIVYQFDEFVNTVLPFTRRDLATQRGARLESQAANDPGPLKATGLSCPPLSALAATSQVESCTPKNVVRHPGARALNSTKLAWDRLADLRLLAAIRGWGGGVPPGKRDEFVFLGACFLAQSGVADRLWMETVALAREFAPTWSPKEIQSCVLSVLSRTQKALEGGQDLHAGVWTDPRYKFRNKVLLERLEVTPSEELELKCIISKEEARCRDRKRKESQRRADGALTREEYLRPGHDRCAAALELRRAGKTPTEIAALLAISKSSVSRYFKRTDHNLGGEQRAPEVDPP